ENPRRARFGPELALDHAVFAPLLDPLLRRVLLEELADRIPEDRDLLVLHELWVGDVDNGHESVPLRLFCQAIVPASRRAAISSASIPSPARIASLSWPGIGADRGLSGAVAE